MHRAAALVCLSFTLALPAQTTHVVSGGGAALQNAINAAAPGDILDVLPGTYTPVTATRGLRILLRAGAEVRVVPFPFPGLPPAITISGLPAGEAFVVQGGAVDGIDALACAGAVVCSRLVDGFTTGTISRIDGCTGPVAFQGTIAATLPTHGTLTIVNSTQVSFTACRLPRTYVTNSKATFAGSSIQPYGGGFPVGYLPSLRILSGSVSVTGCRIDGGVAASATYHESGIELQQGDLVLTGDTHVQESLLWSMPTVPAIATLGGTVRIDPSVTLLGSPPIAGPAVVTFAPTPSLIVARAPASSTYQVTVTAEPASLVFTLIGLPAAPLPLPWGDAWLDPVSPILDVTAMPGSGTWSFTRSLGGVPPFLVLVVQSAALPPNNSPALSPPVRFVWN